MTNPTKFLSSMLFAAFLLPGGCDSPADVLLGESVVVVHEDNTEPVDMSDGQRLDYVMTLDAEWVERCHNYGGSPDEVSGICEDVDF